MIKKYHSHKLQTMTKDNKTLIMQNTGPWYASLEWNLKPKHKGIWWTILYLILMQETVLNKTPRKNFIKMWAQLQIGKMLQWIDKAVRYK